MSASWAQGEQQTVTELLEHAVQTHPDRVFLDFTGILYTYADIDRMSASLAAGLQGLGVGPGDTVATILDNNVNAVLALFAITRIGAVSVPVNTAYKGEFLRHQVSDSRAKVVLAEMDYGERLAAVADGLPHVQILALCGAPSASAHETPYKVLALGDLMANAATLTSPLGQARRSRHADLHLRHHRPVQRVHGQPQLYLQPRAPGRCGRGGIGPMTCSGPPSPCSI